MAAKAGKTEPVLALGIVGSPRRGGNTDTLVSEVLKGAAQAGAKTAKRQLAGLSIGPCRACGYCVRHLRCVQRDDMDSLLGPMERSGVWVLGTPLYWWGPSAQFKAFMDRWFGAVRGFSFRGKRIVVVIPLGDSSPSTARHAAGMLSTALKYVGAVLVETVIGTGLGDKGDARKRPALLRKAREAGARAARQAGRSASAG